ncbi:asparagine synthase-related protein [Pseudomonas sp. GZD-222]|uniref:asparagine synthase-related protein n=1 Tax=Pseudomonas sp. GZD-222 TaxID=3404805 RepID=UPI003BB4B868
MAYELFKSGRLLRAAANLNHLSNYYRSPLITTLREAIGEYKKLTKKLDFPKEFMLQEVGCIGIINPQYLTEDLTYKQLIGMPAGEQVTKSDRRFGALVNQYEMATSPLSALPGRYVYPFLSSAVLKLGLNVAPEQLLKGKIDRYFLRKAAYERYAEKTLWNTRKGGVTGLTQRAISHNKRDITDVLLSGPLIDKGMIESDQVERLIDEISVGAKKCPHFLVHLFSANLFIRHWESLYAKGQ